MVKIILVLLTVSADGSLEWGRHHQEFNSLAACEQAAKQMGSVNYLCLDAEGLSARHQPDEKEVKRNGPD